VCSTKLKNESAYARVGLPGKEEEIKYKVQVLCSVTFVAHVRYRFPYMHHSSVIRLSLTEWNTHESFFFWERGGGVIGVDGRVALMWILKKWVIAVD